MELVPVLATPKSTCFKPQILHLFRSPSLERHLIKLDRRKPSVLWLILPGFTLELEDFWVRRNGFFLAKLWWRQWTLFCAVKKCWNIGVIHQYHLLHGLNWRMWRAGEHENIWKPQVQPTKICSSLPTCWRRYIPPYMLNMDDSTVSCWLWIDRSIDHNHDPHGIHAARNTHSQRKKQQLLRLAVGSCKYRLQSHQCGKIWDTQHFLYYPQIYPQWLVKKHP